MQIAVIGRRARQNEAESAAYTQTTPDALPTTRGLSPPFGFEKL